MLNNQTFYHGTIRNIIIAFGNLFSNISIERRNSAGNVEQLIRVPIAYAQKDKWVQRVDADPDGARGVYTALPRMGFEIVGYMYDAFRKLPRMNTLQQAQSGTAMTSGIVFTPVPYDIELSLFFATKTQEDGLQILEQILPTFSPEYTVSIRTVPAVGIVDDVPFILNTVSMQDEYEGDFETRRFVIHTLSFTAKANLYRGTTPRGVITQVKANVDTNPQTPGSDMTYTATQPTPASPVTEGWVLNL